VASEIKRHYKCMVEDCSKAYGSEGSLNQHIKLKHPEYFQNVMQSNPQHHHANFQHLSAEDQIDEVEEEGEEDLEDELSEEEEEKEEPPVKKQTTPQKKGKKPQEEVKKKGKR